MIRYRTYLEVDQANNLIDAINQNQLHDLLPFLRIGLKGANKSYRLCIDCPVDSHPRIANKLEDTMGLTLTWEEYDNAVKPKEAVGMTPEFKEYVDELHKKTIR